MKFSVLLSVYHKERVEWFNRAVRSIWEDQRRKPDQIVLVKDGPLGPELDSAVAAFSERADDTLTVVPLERNVGLAAALNEGLQHCSHELVARMDTDDISLPGRFEMQVSFMETHPDIDVSSAWMEEFDETGRTIAERKLPLEHGEISRFARSRNPISHPVAIFRKTPVMEAGGYPPLRMEDHALWSLLLARGCRFANLPEVLHRMRTNSDFLERRGYDFLKGEIRLMRYQIDLGLIGWPTLIRNAAGRAVVRLSPAFLKKMLYRYAR